MDLKNTFWTRPISARRARHERLGATSDDIPLRCLVPQRVNRLAVACISGAHEAHSSYRVMPIALATGQAAGLCAALAARAGKARRSGRRRASAPHFYPVRATHPEAGETPQGVNRQSRRRKG